MKILNKLALALLLTIPAIVNAGGIGLYVPISFGDTMDVTLTPDFGTKKDLDATVEYKSTTGFGLTYDSNLGKDELFNYRLGLEWMTRTIDKTTIDGDTESCHGDCDVSRFQIVQTFGFGVLRTEMVRLWIGPRINLGYNYADQINNGNETTEINSEFGIAPVIGINLNFNRWFAVSADVDYRFAYTAGGIKTDELFGPNENFTYTGSNNGATMRLYAIFKFGEDFREGSQYEKDEPQQLLEETPTQTIN